MLHRWSEVPKERITDLFSRQMIHTSTMTIARIDLRAGASVPEHSHANEQVTMCEKGRLRFILNGQETIVHAGESLHIPPHAPHSVEVLEDSIVVDLFSPRRDDWIRGDDAYLRSIPNVR